MNISYYVYVYIIIYVYIYIKISYIVIYPVCDFGHASVIKKCHQVQASAPGLALHPPPRNGWVAPRRAASSTLSARGNSRPSCRHCPGTMGWKMDGKWIENGDFMGFHGEIMGYIYIYE